MVWFSNFQDVFQKIDREVFLPMRKQADIEAAAKADKAARSKAEDQQIEAPRQDSVKSEFRGTFAANELRRIVK